MKINLKQDNLIFDALEFIEEESALGQSAMIQGNDSDSSKDSANWGTVKRAPSDFDIGGEWEQDMKIEPPKQ